MNCIIPFESKVKFKSPVKEICSISLEHEITKNDSELLGNFYISGTYKEHELSVNTNDYSFTIPFSVELTNPIDKDSLTFAIDNFTYDLEGDEMIVKIDYVIDAEDLIKEETPREVIENDREDQNDVNQSDTMINETTFKDNDMNTKPEGETNINNQLLENINMEDDYLIYEVHEVKNSETIESIAMQYKTSKDELLSLNNQSEISPNDKIIIPIIND